MRNRKTKLKIFNEFATREKLEQIRSLTDVLPDPDQILADNNYDFNIYRNLLTDPHLMAAIQQRKQQVQQMDFEIDHDPNHDRREEAKEFFKLLPVKKMINEMLDCLLYGFSAQEIYWELQNGKIIPVDVQEKPQEWFIYNQKNELMLRKSVNGVYAFEEGEKLPEFKFIINRHEPTFDNPYGSKILQKCYWPVTFKRSALEYWQTSVERYGMPFLIGYYPAAATPAEQDELLEQLEQMIENNVTVINETFIDKIKLLESPKYDIGQIYEFLVKFHNSEISKAVLSVTLTIDSGQTGSYKLGQVHQTMLEYIGLTDKKIVEDGMNQLLSYWHYLNYGDWTGPTFYLKKKEVIIVETAERDERLNRMGIDFTDKYLMKRYNLESDDFTVAAKDVTRNREADK
jgi:phage gp29-like protein